DAIDDVVARTQAAMAEASEIILAGFRLRSDAKIIRWPDRYMDDRGREFWGRVMALLPDRPETEADADGEPPTASFQRSPMGSGVYTAVCAIPGGRPRRSIHLLPGLRVGDGVAGAREEPIHPGAAGQRVSIEVVVHRRPPDQPGGAAGADA